MNIVYGHETILFNFYCHMQNRIHVISNYMYMYTDVQEKN